MQSYAIAAKSAPLVEVAMQAYDVGGSDGAVFLLTVGSPPPSKGSPLNLSGTLPRLVSRFPPPTWRRRPILVARLEPTRFGMSNRTPPTSKETGA